MSARNHDRNVCMRARVCTYAHGENAIGRAIGPRRNGGKGVACAKCTQQTRLFMEVIFRGSRCCDNAVVLERRAAGDIETRGA